MKRKGFSLIELLVVLAIIAIISGMMLGINSVAKTVNTSGSYNQLKSYLTTARSISVERNGVAGVMIFSVQGKDYIQLFREQDNLCVSAGNPIQFSRNLTAAGFSDTVNDTGSLRIIAFDKGQLSIRNGFVASTTAGNPNWNLRPTDQSIPGVVIYLREEYLAAPDKNDYLKRHSYLMFANANTGEISAYRRF